MFLIKCKSKNVVSTSYPKQEDKCSGSTAGHLSFYTISQAITDYDPDLAFYPHSASKL
jgi:hypothetical protein